MEIVNTNISGYPLSEGIHELEYNYNSGAPTIALDGGLSVNTVTGNFHPITVGSLITAGNETYPVPDTQRCTVMFDDLPVEQKVTVKFYVDALGGTPHALQDTITVKTLLTRAYAQMGITDVTFDDLTLATDDNTARLSFLGRPPDDIVSETLPCRSVITGGGTLLYIGVGPSLYSYDTATGLYALVVTVANNIVRLFYDSRNTHLWIMESADKGYSFAAGFQVLNVATLTWVTTNVVALRGACAAAACDLMDYLYDGTNYHSSLVVGDVTGYLDEYDQTGARTNILVGWYSASVWRGLFSSSSIYNSGDIVEFRGLPWVSLLSGTNGELPPSSGPTNSWWQVANSNHSGGVSDLVEFDPSTGTLYCSLTRDAGGNVYMAYYAFQTSGVWGAVVPWSASFCDDPSKVRPGTLAVRLADGKAYWWDESQTHLYFQGQSDTVRDYDTTFPPVDGCSGLQAFSGDIYVSLHINNAWMLMKGMGEAPVDLVSAIRLAPSGSALATLGTVIYGLDTAGRLFKLDTTIEMSHIGIDYSAMTIHDVINKSLAAYMLLGKISPMKGAAVYKRINNAGSLVTSGSSITITVDNDGDIIQQQEYLGPREFISVTGQGGVAHTYNGTVFDAGQQPGEAILNLSSEWLPAAVIEDVAYWLWNFASVGHDIFTLPVMSANAEIEVFDGAAVNFQTTKIQKQATGIIMGLSIGKDASLQAKVLF